MLLLSANRRQVVDWGEQPHIYPHFAHCAHTRGIMKHMPYAWREMESFVQPL